jgi:diadenosine tetraphosphate (Ap4A) HIT family hydrolase
MVECFACDVNAGRIGAPGDVIYEDEYWRAEHGIDRLVRGYVVLKPKRHARELADLTGPESAGLGPAMRRLIQAMRSALGTERVYVCSFGETVRHVHFHLIPRYRDMPPLGPALIADLFTKRWECSVGDAERAASLIRGALV